MKNILIIVFALVTIIIIAGCSESTTPARNPVVNIVGELATPFVNIITMVKSKDHIQINEVDSIKIIRIRILMSRMKLFLRNEDTTAGREFKTAPFVYDINETGGLIQLASGSVPPGEYEKIKLEFHRFSASEANQYENDPVFMDFATSDRYSILIEGITYKNENPSVFNFKSQATADLLLKLDTPLHLIENSNTTISIQLDPNFFFKKWGSILDPNDPKNTNDIENTIINTIRAVKK